MKTWFTITNKADQPAAEIDIFDEIGIWGVTVKDFASALKDVPRDRAITLRINSPGGSIFDGHAIYNMLAERREKVTAKVIGLAASMASIIMLAAHRTVAAANATIMIHNPVGMVWGESEDMREMADVLDKLRGQLVNTYASKTGKSEADIKAAMDATTWFTAEEAKDWGLVDEVVGAVKVAANFDLTRFGGVLPERISGGPHSAASTNHHANTVSMKSLLKALVEAKLIASADLPDEAAAAAFTAAFATMQANAKTSSDRVTELEAKLAKADEKEQAALKARAEASVATAVTAGRIKDDKDLRAKWVDSYVRDEESTKSMLASLPEAKPMRGVPPLATGAAPANSDKPRCQSAVEAWGKAGAVILRNSAN